MKNIALQAYLKSQETSSILQFQDKQPLTFQDSLSHVANYPFCTLGLLTAQSDSKTLKGVAFVVDDNYLLTCASNCYSHQNTEYSNITFTINSNRKHGCDTYKIAKVFIPQQYKMLKQNEREQYNYALLFIDGQPNLRDKYGSMKIFKEFTQHAKYFLKLMINQNDGLKMTAEMFKSNNKSSIKRIQSQAKINELMSQIKDNITSIFTSFSSTMLSQIQQWTKTEKREMELYKIRQQWLDLSCFTGMLNQPIRKIVMNRCHLNYRQVFEKLPFSSVMDLDITNHKKEEIQVDFLKMNKFQNLKILKLNSINIGVSGCKYIVEADFSNLRTLNLNQCQVGSKGCQQLSSAKWPFLQDLYLVHCSIGVRGLAFISVANFKNLLHLSMGYNKFGNAQSADDFLEKTAFPRIKFLDFGNNKWSGLSLEFLKVNNWQQLKTLKLTNNPISSNGCKMIKQAGLALQHLNVYKCEINAIGMKWLCKMNMNNLLTFKFGRNKTGNQGCFYLSKANLSSLLELQIDFGITVKGYKLLQKVEWTSPVLTKLVRQGINSLDICFIQAYINMLRSR